VYGAFLHKYASLIASDPLWLKVPKGDKLPCNGPGRRRFRIDLGPLLGTSFSIELWAGDVEPQLSSVVFSLFLIRGRGEGSSFSWSSPESSTGGLGHLKTEDWAVCPAEPDTVVLQLGTLYQQPFKTYLHHHHVLHPSQNWTFWHCRHICCGSVTWSHYHFMFQSIGIHDVWNCSVWKWYF